MSLEGLYKDNKVLWRIYMAMLKQNGTVKLEGRFIKVTTGTITKIYVVDSVNGVLREIA